MEGPPIHVSRLPAFTNWNARCRHCALAITLADRAEEIDAAADSTVGTEHEVWDTVSPTGTVHLNCVASCALRA